MQIGSGFGACVLADFNADGDLDVAVTNNGAGNLSIALGPPPPLRRNLEPPLLLLLCDVDQHDTAYAEQNNASPCCYLTTSENRIRAMFSST